MLRMVSSLEDTCASATVGHVAAGEVDECGARAQAHWRRCARRRHGRPLPDVCTADAARDVRARGQREIDARRRLGQMREEPALPLDASLADEPPQPAIELSA
jgi:hypothetical protein